MNKQMVVERIAGGDVSPVKDTGCGEALVNIALCKYWGKRNEVLNLPVTSSLSVSLPGLQARTWVTPAAENSFSVNGEELASDSSAACRVFEYLELFASGSFRVVTESTVPLAAGLASSASGFAALARAVNDLFGLDLSSEQLSILARLGSGSASRSVYEGFVEWQAGVAEDGMDSFAVRLDHEWPELRVGLLLLSSDAKKVGSREAMKRTRESSVLYRSWPEKVAEDLSAIKQAIVSHDFELLGRHVESNALGMHATMMESWPPVLYWLPESVHVIQQIHKLRNEEGVPVYLTMDAGPNVKLLFPAKAEETIRNAFSKVRVMCPFQ